MLIFTQVLPYLIMQVLPDLLEGSQSSIMRYSEWYLKRHLSLPFNLGRRIWRRSPLLSGVSL
jgi:hypothetical protein